MNNIAVIHPPFLSAEFVSFVFKFQKITTVLRSTI